MSDRLLPSTVSNSSESSPSPVATGQILGLVLLLLLAALVLEVLLASPWTTPFREPGTWVLLGVGTGGALRALGHALARRGWPGQFVLRRISLGLWVLSALGGVLSFML